MTMSLLQVYKFSSLKYAALPCKQKLRFLRTDLAYLKAIKKKKKKAIITRSVKVVIIMHETHF